MSKCSAMELNSIPDNKNKANFLIVALLHCYSNGIATMFWTSIKDIHGR